MRSRRQNGLPVSMNKYMHRTFHAKLLPATPGASSAAWKRRPPRAASLIFERLREALNRRSYASLVQQEVMGLNPRGKVRS